MLSDLVAGQPSSPVRTTRRSSRQPRPAHPRNWREPDANRHRPVIFTPIAGASGEQRSGRCVFTWPASGECSIVLVVPERILVVDDTESIRRLIRLNLELEGFEVFEAFDGQDCLERVATDRPDLVTLDLVMPRLDGFATAAALRADPRTARLPIVVVTTQGQPAYRRRADWLGIDAYVTKPFHPATLVTTVREVLSRRAQ